VEGMEREAAPQAERPAYQGQEGRGGGRFEGRGGGRFGGRGGRSSGPYNSEQGQGGRFSGGRGGRGRFGGRGDGTGRGEASAEGATSTERAPFIPNRGLSPEALAARQVRCGPRVSPRRRPKPQRAE
jgi:hypothetical protein